MSKEFTTIQSLIKQVQELNAGEGHIELSGLNGDPDLTAVISVYEGQNPSHKVLDKLYEWAEENNRETAEMIQMLLTEPMEK